MLLWITLALLTVAVLAAILRPLLQLRAALPSDDVEPDTPDAAVYRDQLVELEADIARGIISPSEAELARREISRRLLRSSAPTMRPQTNQSATLPDLSRTGTPPLVIALAALIPIISIAGYLRLGAPGVPSSPFTPPTGREALAKAPVGELITRVEQRLAQNPSDGQGWDVIAPIYIRLQRFGDAATAYANASRLLGETSARLAGFAEATMMANDGIVTEVARKAYEKLAVLEPDRVEPKFWLLLAKEQDGKTDEAATGYRALLANAPPDAPWRALVTDRLARLTGTAPVVTPASPPSQIKEPSAKVEQPIKGPTAADVNAAAAMSDTDRNAMITGMVEGLATRLKSNGNDPAGWKRLVTAYLVLGQRDKAMAAVADARRALATNEAAASTLAELDDMIAPVPAAAKPKTQP